MNSIMDAVRRVGYFISRYVLPIGRLSPPLRWALLVVLLIAASVWVYFKHSDVFVPFVSVAAGTVLLMLLVAVAVRARARKQGAALDAEILSREGVEALRSRWKDAADTLRSQGVKRTDLPFYMLIGESGSGKTTTIRKSGLSLPLGEEAVSGPGGTVNCDWWFTRNAVLLDTAGRLPFGKEEVDKEEWKAFLRLVKKYRPQCPINGVIVAIPCTSLLGDGPKEHEEKARILSRALVRLEQELEATFPIYVLLTKADRIFGFAEYFSTLDDEQQRQLLGWSRPRDRSHEVFEVDEMKPAFAKLGHSLRRWRLWLLNQPGIWASLDSVDRLFAFPEEVASLRPALEVYLKEIFPKAAAGGMDLVEPLDFRGFYLTSGLQSGVPILQACRSLVGDELSESEQRDQGEDERALFIPDFYSDKLFPEQGRVRPTRGRRRVVGRQKATLFAACFAAFVGAGLLVWNTGVFGREAAAREATAVLARVESLRGGRPDAGADPTDEAEHVASARALIGDVKEILGNNNLLAPAATSTPPLRDNLARVHNALVYDDVIDPTVSRFTKAVQRDVRRLNENDLLGEDYKGVVARLGRLEDLASEPDRHWLDLVKGDDAGPVLRPRTQDEGDTPVALAATGLSIDLLNEGGGDDVDGHEPFWGVARFGPLTARARKAADELRGDLASRWKTGLEEGVALGVGVEGEQPEITAALGYPRVVSLAADYEQARVALQTLEGQIKKDGVTDLEVSKSAWEQRWAAVCDARRDLEGVLNDLNALNVDFDEARDAVNLRLERDLGSVPQDIVAVLSTTEQELQKLVGSERELELDRWFVTSQEEHDAWASVVDDIRRVPANSLGETLLDRAGITPVLALLSETDPIVRAFDLAYVSDVIDAQAVLWDTVDVTSVLTTADASTGELKFLGYTVDRREWGGMDTVGFFDDLLNVLAQPALVDEIPNVEGLRSGVESKQLEWNESVKKFWFSRSGVLAQEVEEVVTWAGLGLLDPEQASSVTESWIRRYERYWPGGATENQFAGARKVARSLEAIIAGANGDPAALLSNVSSVALLDLPPSPEDTMDGLYVPFVDAIRALESNAQQAASRQAQTSALGSFNRWAASAGHFPINADSVVDLHPQALVTLISESMAQENALEAVYGNQIPAHAKTLFARLDYLEDSVLPYLAAKRGALLLGVIRVDNAEQIWDLEFRGLIGDVKVLRRQRQTGGIELRVPLGGSFAIAAVGRTSASVRLGDPPHGHRQTHWPLLRLLKKAAHRSVGGENVYSVVYPVVGTDDQPVLLEFRTNVSFP